MSAEIETMLYVQDTPWHGLGTYVGDENVDSKTAIIKAGLDWSVEKQRLYTSPDQINSQEIPTHKAIVRSSDQRVLGVVGNRYHPIQNLESFEFMDSLVDEGKMKYHTAGSLGEGQRIWLLGKISDVEIVPRDKLDHYLFLYNTHDGSSSLRVLFTTTRVVCANTAQVALSDGKTQGIRVRHTKNLFERLEQAQEILGLANTKFDSFNSWARQAAGTRLSGNDWNDMVQQLIPLPALDKQTKKVITIRQKTRDELTELYYNGVGQDIPGVAGTGWAAYNAVVEYSNYFKKARGTNQQERRFESTLLGGSATLINRAMNLISQAA